MGKIEERAMLAVEELERTRDLRQFIKTVGLWSGKYYRFGNSGYFLGVVCEEMERRGMIRKEVSDEAKTET